MKKVQLLKFFSKFLKSKDIIMLESSYGIGDSSGAFFNYIIDKGYNKKYKIVWIVKDPDAYKNIKIKNVKFCKMMDLRFAFNLMRAKYVIYNDIVIPKFRDDQTVVYLSHGCPPIKNVKGLINVQGDLCICPSEDIVDLISYQFSVDKDKIFICGLPRNDYLFKDIKALSLLTNKKYKKVILWMPTFREADPSRVIRNDSNKIYNFGIPLINSDDDCRALNDRLKENDTLLIIKPHHYQHKKVNKLKQMSNIMVISSDLLNEKQVNLYSLIKDSDALISDYSSVIFDYLLLDRPIGFILDDIDEYKLGFSFDNPLDFMPGEKIYTYQDLITFINHVSEGVDDYKEERKKVRDYTNKYQDGNNCKRLLELLGL